MMWWVGGEVWGGVGVWGVGFLVGAPGRVYC